MEPTREMPMLISEFAERVGASVELVTYYVRTGVVGQRHRGRIFFYEEDIAKFQNKPDRRTSPFRSKKSVKQA
jgi:predicted site-specific integrase-resolvase